MTLTNLPAVRSLRRYGALPTKSALMLPSAALALGPFGQVAAQDVDDNAMAGAGDAFGRQVGTEQIGIYSDNDVRGFDPIDAGNARVQGLYFDELDGLPNRLVDGSTIRVGFSAQGFAFPAPTGLVDYELKSPAAQFESTFRGSVGPYAGRALIGDASVPLGDGLGVLGGFELRTREYMDGGSGRFANFGALVTWRPHHTGEVTILFGKESRRNNDTGPSLFVAGDHLPPRIARGKELGQPWALGADDSSLAGLVTKLSIGSYRLETSLFWSERTSDDYSDTMSGVRSDGFVERRTVSVDLGRPERALSGEARIVREWGNRDLSHRLSLSFRARDNSRRFGGGQRFDLGQSTILERDVRPEPLVDMGELNRDHVHQYMFGIAYNGAYNDTAQLDFGVSKADYRKEVDFASELADDVVTNDRPILWNVSGSYAILPGIRVYAGAASGLEDAPIAPDQAINRSVAPPAIRTRQKDAAVRWDIDGSVSLILGVFDITKPYFNLDEIGRYRRLGDLSSRGVEISLAGEILPGLSVVAGTILFDQSISGEIVEAGRIGTRPIGSARRRSILNFDWRLGDGEGDWSFDVGISSNGKRVANAENTLYVPGTFFLELGARYRFEVFGTQMIARQTIQNLFNGYTWRVSPSGGFRYNDRRRISFDLTASF